MKTVDIRRAQPINDHGGEPTVIRIVEEVPSLESVWAAEEARAMFAADATRLVDALYAALPGGTLDELLMRLLQRRASLFRVGFHVPAPERVKELLADGVAIDSAHHKQWALEQIAEALSVELPRHEEGIAP